MYAGLNLYVTTAIVRWHIDVQLCGFQNVRRLKRSALGTADFFSPKPGL